MSVSSISCRVLQRVREPSGFGTHLGLQNDRRLQAKRISLKTYISVSALSLASLLAFSSLANADIGPVPDNLNSDFVDNNGAMDGPGAGGGLATTDDVDAEIAWSETAAQWRSIF